jgi:hypothetical protein
MRAIEAQATRATVNIVNQVLRIDRFGQNHLHNATKFFGFETFGEFRIAANDDDGQISAIAANVVCDFDAIWCWHVEIKKNTAEVAVLPLQKFDRLTPVLGHVCVDSSAFECDRENRPDRRIIVNDKDLMGWRRHLRPEGMQMSGLVLNLSI